MRFRFVARERAAFPVRMLCRVIGASVSGFYAWLRAIPVIQGRTEVEAELRGHIGRIFTTRRRHSGRGFSRIIHEAGRPEARRRFSSPDPYCNRSPYREGW